MGLFGGLFGITSTEPQLSNEGVQSLTLEFTELAVELINDFVEFPNAVWVSVANDTVPNPAEPWKTVKGQIEQHAVKIVLLQDALEDRQFLRYLKLTETKNGNVNGIMLNYGFEPSLKDFVRWEGRELKVDAVDPIAPIDKPIVYIIEFSV
jgi:hypothetical protein